MSWQAQVLESTQVGNRQDIRVLFFGGGTMFQQSFRTDGTLADLQTQITQAVSVPDPTKTPVVPTVPQGTVIDLSGVQVNPNLGPPVTDVNGNPVSVTP